MINIIISILLVACGLSFIAVGITFIEQWRQRRATRNLVRGTFEHFHCWVGGILGIADVTVGLMSILMAILVVIFPPF